MSNRQSWRSAHGSARPAWLPRWLQQRWPAARSRGRYGSHSAPSLQDRGPLLTVAVFGVLLGVALGLILAVPMSATAAIVQGQPSPINLVAPRSMIYESEVLTRRARDEAAANPTNIESVPDPQITQQQRDEMLRTLDTITRIRDNETLSQEVRVASIEALPTARISAALAAEIVRLTDDRWQAVVDEARKLYDEQNRASGLSEADVRNIKERVLPYIISPSFSETQRNLVVYFVGTFLKPNRMINQEATELRREAARVAVKPVTVTVAKSETVARANEVVSEETYEKLTKLGLVFGAGGRVAFLQKFLLGLLAAWFFSTYLYRYQSALCRNRRALAVIGCGMAAMLIAARVTVPSWPVAPYAFPLAALSILLTVLFDGRIGLLATLLLAPLIGMQTDESIGLTLTLALGSAAGVFAAQRAIRSVSFAWVGLAVAGATMLGAVVFWLDPAADWPVSVYIPLFSLLNGAQASVLALGTYYGLGRAANVVTPLQLMELAHPNQPLLNRLMREAPGTYHHSMVVSNLAELAAENIGADPLLARVGAYYHDIGKILRPYFFTDNQHERSNVHDVLDAKTSATIIIDHVREGVKLAREHGLPQQVVDFIPQHHGTNLVSYFYQRSLQEDGDTTIEDFRYPGPKPQTREAGIMMLADGVEATVRARAQSGKLRPARPEEESGRDGYGMQSIAEVVDQIVTERVRSGQLDECPLTLRDIAVIKESFVKTLQGIYHPRVDYPQPIEPPAETRAV